MDAVPWEIVGNIAVCRLGGKRTLDDGVRIMTQAILRAKAAGIAKLLVDVTAIDVPLPSLMERHWLVTEWANAGRGALRMAVVIRPEFVDPQNFGTVVARSHGLDFRAFTDNEHAMDWLLDRPVSGRPT